MPSLNLSYAVVRLGFSLRSVSRSHVPHTLMMSYISLNTLPCLLFTESWSGAPRFHHTHTLMASLLALEAIAAPCISPLPGTSDFMPLQICYLVSYPDQAFTEYLETRHHPWLWHWREPNQDSPTCPLQSCLCVCPPSHSTVNLLKIRLIKTLQQTAISKN